MLEDDNYDDDDDRRSVGSSMTSPFPAHQLGGHFGIPYHGHSPLGTHESPFAASQIFSQTDGPFNLYSIGETSWKRQRSDDGDNESRPETPLNDLQDPPWDVHDNIPVPFRKGLIDADKDDSSNTVSDSYMDSSANTVASENVEGSALSNPETGAIPFPGSSPSSNQQSSIQFPGSSSSPDRADSPHPVRSRVSSLAEDVHTPLLRSRVHSRFGELHMGEAGWRTRRESSA